MKWAYLFLVASITFCEVSVSKHASGNVQVTQEGSHTQIQSYDPKAILEYQKFDVGANESVRFIMPSQDSKILNRIVGPDPSYINGKIESNGILYFVNPNGLIFGKGAVLLASQFFASCAHLSNQDFLNGVNKFSHVQGRIENWGKIEAGRVHLIAKEIFQNGQIVTKGGFISMTSASDVLIGEEDSFVTIKVDASNYETPNEIVIDGFTEAKNVKIYAADLYGSIIHFGKNAKTEIGSLELNAIVTEKSKGVVKFDVGLVMDKLKVDADVTYMQGFHKLNGNTLIFNSDVELTSDTTYTDSGDITFEKNVFSQSSMFYKLTLESTGGNITVKESVGIDSARALGELKVLDCTELNLLGSVYAHKVDQKSGRSHTHIVGPVMTAMPFSAGGEFKIKTDGNVRVDKIIDTRGDRGTPGVDGGRVEIKSKGSIIVHDINSSGGDNLNTFPFFGGAAGEVVLEDNIEMEVTDKISFAPKGTIGIYGSIIALGGNALNKGPSAEVKISKDRAQFPDVATVFSDPNGSNLEIRAKRIRFHDNSCVTSFGNLTLVAEGELVVADLISIDDMFLSSSTLSVLKHVKGLICLANGARFESQFVHATAGGKITSSGGLDSFIATNQLDLNIFGKSRLRSMLTYENKPLNFNTLSLQSLILTKPMYLAHPYGLQPDYKKMNAFILKNGSSIDALASQIDILVYHLDPGMMQTWEGIRNAVLEKNPLDGVVGTYLNRIRTGTFSPPVFIERLKFSKKGREALTYIHQILTLKTALLKNESSLSDQAVDLITLFTLPPALTEEQWENVNRVIQLKKAFPVLN